MEEVRAPEVAGTAANALPRLPRFDDRLEVGRVKRLVSPFCLGAVADPETICVAYDHGINFFFVTCDLHWTMYEGSREGLRRLVQRRPEAVDDIVVALVSYISQPEFMAVSFHDGAAALSPLIPSFRMLIAGGTFGYDLTARLGKLHELRSSGYLGVEVIGVTFHDRLAARLAVNVGALDIAFIRYNALHPGAETDLFPHLDPTSPTRLFNFGNTIGHFDDEAWGHLGDGAGAWRPTHGDYYRMVLSRPELQGMLCAPGRPKELLDLREALEAGPLPPDQTDEIFRLGLLGRSMPLKHAGRTIPPVAT